MAYAYMHAVCVQIYSAHAVFLQNNVVEVSIMRRVPSAEARVPLEMSRQLSWWLNRSCICALLLSVRLSALLRCESSCSCICAPCFVDWLRGRFSIFMEVRLAVVVFGLMYFVYVG